MYKRGDIKDGKVFWAKAKECKNGEHWVSQEKFEIFESNRKLFEQKNRAKRAARMSFLRQTNPKYFYRPSKERKIKDALRYQKNKKKVQERERLRMANNPQARLAQNLRNRLRLALHGVSKGAKSLTLFGCDNWGQLTSHLQSQFKKGMTWSNYGKVWHVDHIMPCASFDLTKESHKKRCFHYTNLQPMFAMENFQKNKKQPSNHQFKLL